MPLFTLGPRDGSSRLTANVVNSSSGTITVVAAPGAGLFVRVYRLFLVFGNTSNITFQDGASNALSGAIPMVANGSITLDLDGQPWFECAVNQSFQIVNSNSVSVNGCVYTTTTGFIT
jgi:hypothetical protein